MVFERLSWRVRRTNHASFRRLSLDSCQKRFLLTHKEVDLAPRTVVGLVLQVGDTEMFPHALESLVPLKKIFFRVSKQNPFFTAVEEDGGLVYSLLIIKAHPIYL